MESATLAKKLKGFQTVETVCKTLGISRRTAINYLYVLKKNGYAKATRGKGKIRLYRISDDIRPERGYIGLYDFINKYSRLKLAKTYEHRIYDHELTPEEAVVRALETGDFRAVLASLNLFRHIENWSKLYMFAKKHGRLRDVGALYDLARKYIKVRRMDKRIRLRLIKSKLLHRYVIKNMKSDDFQQIEELWGIKVPFNRGDMERLKTG